MTLRSAVFLLKEMLRSPLSILVTLIISIAFLLFALWFPIRQFLWFMLTESSFSTSGKIQILATSLQGIETNYTTLSRTLLVISALLTGMVLGALVVYLGKRINLERSAGTSILGVIASVIGIGCASCGSIILSSLFGIGALSLTAALPLNGIEFSILGIVLLLYSFFSIANKYTNPLVCERK